jgi:hypothetical protein
MNLPSKTLALSLAVLSCGALAAERPHLVQPDNLSKFWLVSETPDPMVPSSGQNLTAPSCATVSYEIERGGTTSHVKLESIEPAGVLADVAVNLVKNLKYTAAAMNVGKDPVYTYVTLPFNLPSPALGPKVMPQRQEVLDKCKLEDFKLPAALQ